MDEWIVAAAEEARCGAEGMLRERGRDAVLVGVARVDAAVEQALHNLRRVRNGFAHSTTPVSLADPPTCDRLREGVAQARRNLLWSPMEAILSNHLAADHQQVVLQGRQVGTCGRVEQVMGLQLDRVAVRCSRFLLRHRAGLGLAARTLHGRANPRLMAFQHLALDLKTVLSHIGHRLHPRLAGFCDASPLVHRAGEAGDAALAPVAARHLVEVGEVHIRLQALGAIKTGTLLLDPPESAAHPLAVGTQHPHHRSLPQKHQIALDHQGGAILSDLYPRSSRPPLPVQRNE